MNHEANQIKKPSQYLKENSIRKTRRIKRSKKIIIKQMIEINELESRFLHNKKLIQLFQILLSYFWEKKTCSRCNQENQSCTAREPQISCQDVETLQGFFVTL